MNETRGLESLELDLGRAATRLRAAGFDPRRTRRRLWWSEYGPIAGIVLVALSGLLAAGIGHWVHVGCVLLFLLPRRIDRWRARRAEREALLVADDFLERERALLEDRASGERTLGVLFLGVGTLIAVLAWTKDGPAPGLWTLSAMLGAYALFRIAVIGPALARELRDLGGEPEDGWLFPVLMAALIAIAPFAVVYGILRRAVRRMLGRPEEDGE
ncbi:MAG: hypothetical protein NTY35_04270 [Planctomycetota bacterium]|nr:hypothetical protein [Planctomycetota bacterium]